MIRFREFRFLEETPSHILPRKKSSSAIAEPEDLYVIAHRTFELTSFDQLLKEAVQNKRIVTINDVNQTAFQSTSFMKLWKTVRQRGGRQNAPKHIFCTKFYLSFFKFPLREIICAIYGIPTRK